MLVEILQYKFSIPLGAKLKKVLEICDLHSQKKQLILCLLPKKFRDYSYSIETFYSIIPRVLFITLSVYCPQSFFAISETALYNL